MAIRSLLMKAWRYCQVLLYFEKVEGENEGESKVYIRGFCKYAHPANSF